jgi:hypothetical protein
MENPALSSPNGEPVPMPSEFFVLSRHGISFSAKSGSWKGEGRGNLYLSTLRIVFVVRWPPAPNGRGRLPHAVAALPQAQRGGSCESFDLPLGTMHNERFNQPIFGANNMTGTSEPLPGGLTDEIKWTLTFKEGGVGTFLPLFFRLVQEMRRRMAQESQSQYEHSFAAPPVAQQVVQHIIGAAYVDPNDPTKLYVSQPVVQPNVPVATAVPMQ